MNKESKVGYVLMSELNKALKPLLCKYDIHTLIKGIIFLFFEETNKNHKFNTKGNKMKKESKGEKKISKVMKEYKAGTLHSGSKKGPMVRNPRQALAIGLSEARTAGAKIPKKKGKNEKK